EPGEEGPGRADHRAGRPGTGPGHRREARVDPRKDPRWGRPGLGPAVGTTPGRRPGGRGGGLSSTAHSAGVSVSATMPDNTTATAMVIANWRYMRPVMPPRNATGTNTAHSTSTMAINAPLTWRIARSAATAGHTRSAAPLR